MRATQRVTSLFALAPSRLAAPGRGLGFKSKRRSVGSDELQYARAHQDVFSACGTAAYVNRLVPSHPDHFVSPCHSCGSIHYDPFIMVIETPSGIYEPERYGSWGPTPRS